MEKDIKYYIYGAGQNIVTVYAWLSSFVQVEGIIDQDESKRGKNICGTEITSTKTFFERIFQKGRMRIVVSVTQKETLKNIIYNFERRGLIPYADYVLAADLCRFSYSQIPGLVSPVHGISRGYAIKKSCDPKSFLVERDNRIFRVYRNPRAAEEAKKVLQCCENAGLFGKYVVESYIPQDVTDFKDQFLIEHEFINSPISFCYEWSPALYEEYVYYMLDFAKKLTENELGLIDAHGLNATLYKGKFVFFDFGAIKVGRTCGRELYELVETLVLPLILMKVGEMKKAYFYLEDHSILLTLRDIVGYLTMNQQCEINHIYEEITYIDSSEKMALLIDKIKGFCINFGSYDKNSEWWDYQDSEWNKTDNREQWSIKMKNVVEMIGNIEPKRIIDLAGNQGWYGSYFHEQVESVVVTDMDLTALDRLWNRISEKGYSNVLPLKMSICAPSLGRHYDGFVDGVHLKPIRTDACERFKSDLAIALAIVHHLAFREHLVFNEIISVLSMYTTRYLLVEFVDSGDRFITDFIKTDYEWYTKENFEQELKGKYRILVSRESSPSETRTLYLCEKK